MGLFDSWKITSFNVPLAQKEVRAGEYISGNVQFEVTEDMPFRRVYVDVFAIELGVIDKEDLSSSSGNAQSRTYSQQVRVFAHNLTLLGTHLPTSDAKSADLPKLTLKKGIYDFPFAVQIPANSPPTIRQKGPTSDLAAVMYKAAAVVDVPFAYNDPQSVTEFDVITPMPISQVNESVPVEVTIAAERYTCLCCSAGTTSCTLTTNRNRLVLQEGTTIEGTVSIDASGSTMDLKNLEVFLRRRCWVTASSYETILAQNVAGSTIEGQVRAGEGERRFPYRIVLPATAARSYGPGYRGTIMVQHYEVVAMSDHVPLAILPICCGDSVDETNTAPPIATLAGKEARVPAPPTYSSPNYPRKVYAPPPGARPSVPAGMESHFPHSTSGNTIEYNVVEGDATGYDREPAAGTVVMPNASTPLIRRS